jgi:hypothetical protein
MPVVAESLELLPEVTEGTDFNSSQMSLKDQGGLL